jgi:serine/threonine protein kinase
MELPPNLAPEKLAQRIHETGLMQSQEIDAILSKAGGRGNADLELFVSLLLRGEHLTNWQITRLVEGHRQGYFYNNWKVLYLIGAGTFARVYRATNIKTAEIKAVKVLRSRHSGSEEMREHFLREGRMVMKLRHPNIVPIHEVDTERNRIYMVMDFVEGQNLRDYVRTHKKLSVKRALKIGADIAMGLAYASEHGVNHRDMKLSNVLLSTKGQARLVDFGLATIAGDSGELTGGPRSIDYAGLERTTGVKRDDKRSDIFFLGCMIYHMLCGVPPLLETRERIKRLAAERYRDVKPITIHDPDLPHRAVVTVNRLMELNADNRIQTPQLAVNEINMALEAIKAGDDKKYDESLSKQQAEEYSQMMTAREEGRGHTLLLIESNISLQNSLREKLKDIGYRVLITNDPERGLERFQNLDPAEPVPADCVLFGCAGLGQVGVQAFRHFTNAEDTKKFPAILIAPDKLDKYIDDAWFEGEGRARMALPLKFKRIKKALRQLLKIEVPDSA